MAALSLKCSLHSSLQDAVQLIAACRIGFGDANGQSGGLLSVMGVDGCDTRTVLELSSSFLMSLLRGLLGVSLIDALHCDFCTIEI